jgi:hypothetical protein
LTKDLFFRAKLEGLVKQAGCKPVREGDAALALVELGDPTALQRVREMVAAGVTVVAFGSHVRAEELRVAREAGAQAVPNSQVEDAVRAALEPE